MSSLEDFVNDIYVLVVTTKDENTHRYELEEKEISNCSFLSNIVETNPKDNKIVLDRTFNTTCIKYVIDCMKNNQFSTVFSDIVRNNKTSAMCTLVEINNIANYLIFDKLETYTVDVITKTMISNFKTPLRCHKNCFSFDKCPK